MLFSDKSTSVQGNTETPSAREARSVAPPAAAFNGHEQMEFGFFSAKKIAKMRAIAEPLKAERRAARWLLKALDEIEIQRDVIERKENEIASWKRLYGIALDGCYKHGPEKFRAIGALNRIRKTRRVK